jgi:gluconolactonase
VKTWPLRVYAVLPDSLRRSGHSQWGVVNRRRGDLHSFLEGPVVEPSGSLLVVDVAWGRVIRIYPSGSCDVVLEYEGAPNGLALTDEGKTLVIADSVNGLIWAEVVGSALIRRRDLRHWQGSAFLGLNDLIVSASGAIFFTDQGMTGLQDPSGRVLHLASDGTETVLLAGIPSPNGLALAAGEKELFVAVTRDNAIWRVPFDERLRPYRVGRFVQLSGGTGPDGIAFGADGWLFVAHLGLGVVWAIDARGRVVGAFEAPRGLSTTNVAHDLAGGVIYVTEADTGSVLVGDLTQLPSQNDITRA